MVFLVNMNVAGYLPESDPGEFDTVQEAIRDFGEMLENTEAFEGNQTHIEMLKAEALQVFANGHDRYAHCENGHEWFIAKESI